MPFFSLLMPTYGHEELIEKTLISIQRQKFLDYEVIIVADGCSDAYRQIAKNWETDTRFKFILDLPNVGYCRNLSRCLELAKGEYIIYFASDDIMAPEFLGTYANVYRSSPKVEAIVRTYYAFDENVNISVRAKRRLSNDIQILNIIESSPKEIQVAMETLDQLTGLSFKSYQDRQLVNCDVFPCHVYPIMDIILKTNTFAYLSLDLMAVRIGASQCRSISSIYNTSPIASWVKFLKFYFPKSKHQHLQSYLLKNWIGVNYVGFFQIRNFSQRPLVYLFREILYLLKINPSALINPIFLICVGLCLFLPPFVLIKVTDFVKSKLLRVVDSNVLGRSIFYNE
jgi:glycosyltransferase involved in cell wall biosynthesis